MEVSLPYGKKRRISVFDRISVFYCDPGTAGDDHRDVSGTEDQA